MKQNTMYIKHSYDDQDEAIKLGVNSYVTNGQIAILLYNTDWEYYSDLSVFVEPFDYQNYMAVDVNNLPTAEEFIQKYNLGELVDYVHSWFVTYPVYAMDMDELKKWDEKGVSELASTEFKPRENNRTVWDNIQHN